MLRNFFAALTAVCFFYACPAQDLHYTHYSVNEGLPSSQVHDIVQDEYGRLWFTTDQGLSCYDGYTFKNYTTADGMTDDVVFKFLKRPDGKIWCTTFNHSVFYFSGKDPVFTAYSANGLLDSIPDNYISNSLAITEDGSLFMGFVNARGYIHIDGKGQMVQNNVNMVSTFFASCLLVDKNNTSFFFNAPQVPVVKKHWEKVMVSTKKLIATHLSRACYLPRANTAVYADFDNIEILPEGGEPLIIPSAFQPISLGQFTDTSFWVGFRYGGLAIYDLNGKCLFKTLNGKSVTRILVDHEGGYWCSTLHDGVFHARNTGAFFYSSVNDAKNWIHMLCKDRDNKLWIGYYHGNIDRMEHGKVVNIYAGSGNLPALIRRSEKGEAILFSDGKIIFSSANRKTLDTKVTPLGAHVVSSDSIVICGYGGYYSYFNGQRTTIPINRKANSIIFYRHKWHIAANDGLYSVEPDTSLKKVLNEIRLVGIEKWNDRLVLASKTSGVIVWNGVRSFKIGTAQGLCSNTVLGIYPENDSVIWAYTNAGAGRIVVRNNQVVDIRNISTNDGLVSNEVTAVEVVNDTVWIGTRQGLCFFPQRFLNESKKRPPTNYLHISAIKINDKTRTHELKLGHYENRVEFSFGAVSFSESQKPQYRYRLLGLETGWNHTLERSALYASLPAGNYIFEVQVKTAGTDWGKTTRLSFAISPPFWKTWWFMAAVTVALVVLVYLFFRFRILSYNRDITRELLRQLLKRLKRKTNHVVFREQGKDIRIPTETICYVRADGNYIEIHTDTKKYVVRHKIGEFIDIVPDPLEYLRVNRSYVVRLDKVQEKSKKDVTVKGETIAVGETYLDQLQKIKF